MFQLARVKRTYRARGAFSRDPQKGHSSRANVAFE